LLAKNRGGNTTLHLAAQGRDTQDTLQKLCDLAKGNLTTEVIKNKLLLTVKEIPPGTWQHGRVKHPQCRKYVIWLNKS
jgi:hypothetical protein